MKTTRLRTATTLGALLVLTVALVACDSDQQSTPPAEGETTTSIEAPPSSRHPVAVEVSLTDVDTAGLPLLRPSELGLPESIPARREALPALLDNLPGRVTAVVNADMAEDYPATTLWSDVTLLFFGIDGRWRQLRLDALGFADEFAYTDVAGAGALSSDGRWWAGEANDGIVTLDLSTGQSSFLAVPIGPGALRWVPGRHAVLTTGAVISVPGGEVERVPYATGAVAHEPDGTPLSVERGPGPRAVLVEWDGRTRSERTELPDVTPPRFGVDETDEHLFSGFEGGSASRDRFAITRLGGNRSGRDVTIVVSDSTSGDRVGELTWQRRECSICVTENVWLDDETLLVVATPRLVAWRPTSGELFRFTDASAISSPNWDIALAPNATP